MNLFEIIIKSEFVSLKLVSFAGGQAGLQRANQPRSYITFLIDIFILGNSYSTW